MSRITVNLYAGAAAAAGASRVQAEASTLDELFAGLAVQYGAPLARVLDVASVLVDGVCASDRYHVLPETATVEVLPPFAGG